MIEQQDLVAKNAYRHIQKQVAYVYTRIYYRREMWVAHKYLNVVRALIVSLGNPLAEEIATGVKGNDERSVHD